MSTINGDRAIEEVARDILLGMGQTPNKATVNYLTAELSSIVAYAVKYAADLVVDKEISASEKNSSYLYGLCGHNIS